MANTLSKLTTAGNLYTTGTLDEATFNPNSGYRKNLVNYSQTYTTGLGQTGWAISHTGSIVSTNELAPDGTYTAMRFRPAAQYDSPRTNACWLPNVTQVGSVWVKVDSGTRTLSIGLNGGGAGISFTATSTWQRIITPAYVKYVNYSDFLIIQDSNTSGFVDYLIWGAQVEVGSSATIYEPTGSAGALVTNTLSKLDTSGNYYTAGTIDEVTFNPNSGYTKNLLVNSNLLGGTSGLWGSGAVSPTNYVGNGNGGGISFATALSGIGNSCRFYCTSARPYVNQYNYYPIQPGVTYTFTVTIESITTSCGVASLFYPTGVANGSFAYYLNGVLVTGSIYLTQIVTGKYQVVFTSPSYYPPFTVLWRIGPGVSGPETADCVLANPQIEVGNTVTTSPSIISYQPTTASGTLASTNALSKLDTAGNHYLSGTYDEFTKGANLVTDGLIYYMDPAKPESWKGSSTVQDITGTNLPGSIVGNYTYNIDGGGSIQLDGQTSYANTGIIGNTSPFQSTTEFTMSVWCKFTGRGKNPAGTSTLFGAFNFQGFGICWQTDTIGIVNAIYGIVRPNNGIEYVNYTANTSHFQLNQWYNYVFVYSSSNLANIIKLYVNNSQAISGAQIATNLPYSTNMQGIYITLGNILQESGSQAGYFPGSIGQALIYNRALSATEISQNFTEMRSRYGV